ncbi:NHLP bacteriocin system secretion protein [Pseudodesulfovibrio sp.]|uniref:NHLP bacteriocin system secretion protein n=1 Tax=Pseudodesulfovibrio sp. TaxID=2035812 RepID=UPI00261F2324|nr:NHLP bacteriocin system secretion protein [Pseudodesulfovibrio sp.]MDD3311169.1 NHLP bacteriocin system secretion protein [Pseudodesulfovibrio sp.]
MNEQERKRRGNPLASPEELSRRIAIVDAKGKFAVAAGILLAVVLVGWSVFGSVPEMVLGSGILVPPDGLMDVVALGRGQLTEVDAAPGDTVSSGDILARVSMPELESERQSILAGLRNAKLRTAERERHYALALDMQGRNGDERIRQLRSRMAYLQQYFDSLQKKTPEAGGQDRSSAGEVEAGRKDMQSVLADINDCKLRIAEVRAAGLDLEGRAERDALEGRRQESELELALEGVERRLQLFTKVRSPYDGVVVDMDVERGDYVSPGMSLLTLRPVESPLEASLLFPAEVGKRIRPGMVAYVYPSTASKEEYGCIYGLVSSVGEYPASAESLMKSIGSRQLVSSLLGQGVTIMARVSLLRDPETATGFKWSSSDGPQDVAIDAGTVCTGNVVLRRSRPVDLVFPKFSGMLGLAEP